MIELHWQADTLCSELGRLLPGIRVDVIGETGSTNTDLLEEARAALRGGVADFAPRLRVAERQTAGRGRHGRTWWSQRGDSLTFSLARVVHASDWSGLSLAVGVALADALEPAASARPRVVLKWPNDLWLSNESGLGRKLGGVLIESVSLGGVRVAVIGVGLNVRPLQPMQPIANASADLSSGHASAAELDADASAPALLLRLAPALIDALQVFEREGFAAFGQCFAARDLLRGRAVRTSLADLGDGVAEGVGADGSLLVRKADGSLQAVASGEVSVRVVAASPAAEVTASTASEAMTSSARPATSADVGDTFTASEAC